MQAYCCFHTKQKFIIKPQRKPLAALNSRSAHKRVDHKLNYSRFTDLYFVYCCWSISPTHKSDNTIPINICKCLRSLAPIQRKSRIIKTKIRRTRREKNVRKKVFVYLFVESPLKRKAIDSTAQSPKKTEMRKIKNRPEW